MGGSRMRAARALRVILRGVTVLRTWVEVEVEVGIGKTVVQVVREL